MPPTLPQATLFAAFTLPAAMPQWTSPRRLQVPDGAPNDVNLELAAHGGLLSDAVEQGFAAFGDLDALPLNGLSPTVMGAISARLREQKV